MIVRIFQGVGTIHYSTAMLFMLLLFSQQDLQGQSDSLASSLNFESDFRFRIEQDWNARKSDGSYRDDRSRLRYRFRFGFKYSKATMGSFVARVRTGLPNKQ